MPDTHSPPVDIESAEAQLTRARRQRFAIPRHLNLALLIIIQSAITLCWVIPVWLDHALWAQILFAFLFGTLLQPLYALLHECMHDIFHPNRTINNAAGRLLSLWMLSSFNMLRFVHLGHHASNRSKRERIEYYEDGTPAWKQALFYYAVLLGLNWIGFVLQNLLFSVLPIRLLRQWKLDRNIGATLPLIPDDDIVKIRHEFLTVLTAHAAIVVFTPVDMAQMGWFLLMNAAFYSQIRYIYHYKSAFDVVEGAFDLRAPRWLQCFLLNTHLHLTHHRNPKVPWHALPRVAAPDNIQYGFFEKLLEQWRGVWPESSQANRNGRTISWNGDSMLSIFNGSDEEKMVR